MHQFNPCRRFITAACLLFTAIAGNGQTLNVNTDFSLVADPSLYIGNFTYTLNLPLFLKREEIISRDTSAGDMQLIRFNHRLVTQGPDTKNHETYSALAAAYWRKGNNSTAKKMFLVIEQSRDSFYTGTLFHSAGNVYEYGSYTSSFKNDACLHLCKIYLEERNYRLALAYLLKADKNYKVKFNCGTGAHGYSSMLKTLYAACYEGLKDSRKLIDLYLEENFYGDEAFVRLLQKKYPYRELKRQVQLALDNITITRDNQPTIYYMESSSGRADSVVARFISGTGTTILFGRKISLPLPELKHGDEITRKHFTDALMQSQFCHLLLGWKEKEEPPAEGSSPD